MSNVGFPIVDLMRRRMQTGITIATLTLSITSTLFLLFFASRLGVGFTSTIDVFTLGISAVFRQFILFIGVLIFIIGIFLSSFIVFLMMAQRTRDFGLIKAAGCPNSLTAGYFATELITVTLISCILGIVFGFLIDFVFVRAVFSSYQPPNFWFAVLVFAAFFILTLSVGFQPILKAARMSPSQALSTANYYGLSTETKHRVLSTRNLTLKIASRSLLRHQSVTFRIVILLSTAFILLTVSIAGGIIAKETTTLWVQQTINKNTIVVANSEMGKQYELLLSTFSGASRNEDFDYFDPSLGISNSIISQISVLPRVKEVDSRLVVFEDIKEVGNFTVISGTTNEIFVGDSREGKSLVVGVNPKTNLSKWAIQGRFLDEPDAFKAVIGDSISQSVYYPNLNRDVVLSDPLVESIRFQNATFDIVGICVDPVNNGFVTYVPLDVLENITRLVNPNLLLVSLDNSIDPNSVIDEVRSTVHAVDSDLEVFDISNVIGQNDSFLASAWQTVVFLPILTLFSATLCLVGYMMLAAEEQRQELGVLRAIGAKKRLVVSVLAIQSFIVLASSFAVGVSLGSGITLMILMKQPIVTLFAIFQITGLLIAALAGIFILSLYPARRVAKSSILKNIA